MGTGNRRHEVGADDPRRDEARRLREEEGLSRSQLMKVFGVGNGTLSEWLRGTEVPEWTRRPRAKDDLREQAVELRRGGATVPEIAVALGVSKSSAYLWTRHMPLDATPEEAAARRSRHSKQVAEARWEPLNQARDDQHARIAAQEESWVGDLTGREVMLLGAVAYWCEGEKNKPWRPQQFRMRYINSDAHLILLFLRFLEGCGIDRAALTYRLSIHESADVEAATRWWSEVVGVPVGKFRRPTLKTHNPSTVRHNVGDPYRGCLVIFVPKSRELYWKVEGLMRGIADAMAQLEGGSM
jgi:transposase